MATFYLDPIGGNDANDGLSFAQRWKTLGSGATFGRVDGAGHTIRLIESGAPVTPGSASWTDNSRVITWASGQPNKVIDDCESGWVGAANVTVSADASYPKSGSNTTRIAPASGFTTGKMAYKATGALDLSAYEGVSFWVRGSNAGAPLAAGALELRLCSDTAGDVAVHTIPFPAQTASSFRVVVWDNAAALSASIQSVAVYATVDPSTGIFYVDNIVACKAKAASDYVTHAHVIGKMTAGEPEWYAIGAISDTGVEIGSAKDANRTSCKPYRGTTESVATYVMYGLDPAWSAADRLLNASGVKDAFLTLSGGWNAANMSTQSGVTYLQGLHYSSYGVEVSGGRTWLATENIGFLNYAASAIYSAGGLSRFQVLQIVGCTDPFTFTSASDRIEASVDYLHAPYNTLSIFPATGAGGPHRLTCKRLHGAASVGSAAIGLRPNVEYWIDKIDNTAMGGIICYLPVGTSARMVGLADLANIGAGGAALDMQEGILVFDDCPWTGNPNLGGTTRTVRFHRTRGGSTNPHETRAVHWTLAAQTTDRHTASGYAWTLSHLWTDASNAYAPAVFPLGLIAVDAASVITVKVWIKRSSTSSICGLRIPARAVPGVGDAHVIGLASGAADTWEQVSVSFTATAAGVFEVQGLGYGAGSAIFDDLTVERI